jgi:phosphoglycerol transferase MdoB-like AlkP superfamily enzyme
LIGRVVFVLFFSREVFESSFFEILKIIPKSFSLDISFISYLLVIIVLFMWVFSFFKKGKKLLSKLIFGITSMFLIFSALVNGGEVSLYSEWQTKLNYTALSHFSNPKEVFSTASFSHIFTMVLFIFVSVVFIRIYKRKVHLFFPLDSSKISWKSSFLKIIFLPFILGVLLFGIRGGFQPIPMNLSNAYFSNNLILNDIAVNPNWNILQSIFKSKTNFNGNPYKKYSDKECEKFISEFYKVEKDTTISVLNVKHPNIVFILLESWSADNVESLGGLKGITPNFKGLENGGLLFTDFYSNGWTSDQGMSSIFSSFPVFPYVAIINQADKSRRLPALSKSLKNYNSSYFFGGQLTYGNIKAYLLSQGFDLVKDEDNYSHLPSGRLGVHDEFMFSQFKEELSVLKEPFMSTLFTISSHSPYDFPAEHKLFFNSKEDKYVNSVAYTDKCLGDFMESVKTEDWYENTLFVIVADHSHNSPKGWKVAEKERFKIPMLWFGKVLEEEYKGKTHDKMGSHIDITPTILSQLEINNDDYSFGRNLFNPTLEVVVPFAFCRGFGLITEDGYYAFSESYNKVFEIHAENPEKEKEIKRKAELFFQSAFKKYMDL